MSPTTAVYEPTPVEIRQACTRIQKSWSPYERRRRALGLVDDLTVPLTELGLLPEELPHEVLDF